MKVNGRRGRRNEQLVRHDSEGSAEPEEKSSVVESEEGFRASVSHRRPRSPLQNKRKRERENEPLGSKEEGGERERGLTLSAVLAWWPELRRPRLEMGESLAPNRGREDLETAARNMDMVRRERRMELEVGRSPAPSLVLSFPFFS